MSQLHKESNRIRLILNKRERKTLTHIRDNDKKPHRRERAAALLKVADGMSPHAVALSGLLQPRDPDTVYAWVVAFAQHGVKSLDHAPRRNRTSLTADEEAELRRIITEQSPQDYGLSRSRWTLANLRQVISALNRIYKSLSGVWYLLQQLRIHFKRGRDVVKSPDSEKRKKIRRVRALLGYARQHTEQVVLLFLDEFGFYRQPLVGPAWWPAGRTTQPPARRSCRSNTRGRIVAALNAVTGELTYELASKITVTRLCSCIRSEISILMLKFMLSWTIGNGRELPQLGIMFITIQGHFQHSQRLASTRYGCLHTHRNRIPLNVCGSI